MGKYEVTQAQYEAVMTGNTNSLSPTPSEWPGNPNRPVEDVSWDDAQVFLTRLNAQQATNLPAGWSYVLPTETQWEYACRAGTKTAFSFGDSLTSGQANISGRPRETTDVGKYPANGWGFHDMHGNVWEWCADWYGDYPAGAARDPVGPAVGSARVERGGSWISTASNARSAYRYRVVPALGINNLGFRLSLRPASK